jgi:hypothetical protein
VDTLCLIFKQIGDYLLELIGVCVAVCTISPALGTRFKRWERSVRKSFSKRLILGISLAAFCVALIAASLRIQIVQSREQEEQLKTQSLKYQSQMLLKEHINNFAANIIRFSNRFGQSIYDQDELQTSFYPEINDYTKQLYAEGIWSTNLESLFDASRTASTPQERAANLMNIAKEFKRLADQLPTNE